MSPDDNYDPDDVEARIASIQAEVEAMKDKFSWWDVVGIVVLALGVITVCGAAIAALNVAGIVACLVMLWWFVDHCLDFVDATDEMLKERDAIKKKVQELEEIVGHPG